MLLKRIHGARAALLKVQPIMVWLMSAWFAHSMILNGVRKLDVDGLWTSAFEDWGYPVWFRIFIGVLEIFGGIVLLIPKLRYIGGFVLCAVMIGALGTRLVFGTGYEDAIYLLFAAISFLFFANYGYRKSVKGN
ncbi:DoxX family protein [Spongiimicrobium sp. 2-473A-2-J]|uniref:DoxX family protein n=1 Tax=Eudoraea algarum TaxID=3417568 RepID=UPI003D35ABE4